ncbi:transposase [Sinorhizobium meliloti]|uniref:transposase n=1 Tax=Rhizobium meliloti TaxID=382 RepID=UPI003B3BC89A
MAIVADSICSTISNSAVTRAVSRISSGFSQACAARRGRSRTARRRLRSLACASAESFAAVNPGKLNNWIDDAAISGLVAIARFARVLHRDLDAVCSAIELLWSNGQAEGQINPLKTIKRAMYGRAGPELLRARMLPLDQNYRHKK